SAGVALWAALIFEGWLFWVSCGLGWALLTLSAADARHFMLPDKLTLPLIVAGLAFSYAHAPSFLFHHILGAAIGFTIFYAVSYCYRKIRGREGLGLGDAKLMAGAGAWLGWGGLPSVVLWGGFSALIWAIGRGFVSGNKLTGDTALPFGPFLTLGIWLVWLYGPFTLSLPFMSGF
ncbi:MAG: A24 family peptidase, partial [Rhodospirillales bacterium]|nr:A24 family peptidase [Rhodospirillales bacterium]